MRQLCLCRPAVWEDLMTLFLEELVVQEEYLV